MKFFDWVAAVVLLIELPVPVFWLMLHPLVGFWRLHVKATYVFAGLAAWGTGGLFLAAFHDRLFSSARAPGWAIAIGLALVALEAYLFPRVEHELGSARMVGHAELKGTGEIETTGLYARVRHPRYVGMIAAVLGACLMAGTLFLWTVVGAWLLLTLLVVSLEERELRARFGEAYIAYSRRVPRLFPFRLWPGEE